MMPRHGARPVCTGPWTTAIIESPCLGICMHSDLIYKQSTTMMTLAHARRQSPALQSLHMQRVMHACIRGAEADAVQVVDTQSCVQALGSAGVVGN
jgi:hypothetical protein